MWKAKHSGSDLAYLQFSSGYSDEDGATSIDLDLATRTFYANRLWKFKSSFHLVSFHISNFRNEFRACLRKNQKNFLIHRKFRSRIHLRSQIDHSNGLLSRFMLTWVKKCWLWLRPLCASISSSRFKASEALIHQHQAISLALGFVSIEKPFSPQQ